MATQGQLTRLTEAIKDKFAPKRIILFGSRAYGEADEDSDIDLCIITDMKEKRKIDVMRAIRWEIHSLVSSPLDILVYDEKEFEERAGLRSTLEYKIRKEGKRLL